MTALDVRCPTCGAKPGEVCLSVHRQNPCRKPHRQRETRATGRPKRVARRDGRYAKARRWAKVRAWCLDRDGHRCVAQIDGVCHGRADHAHHILPRSAGGPDELWNLISACDACHAHIHANPTWSYAHGFLRSRYGGRVA
jgi:hypothetical protein